jgi:hypothetical protein
MYSQILILIAPILIAIILSEIIPLKSAFKNLQKQNKKVMTIIYVSQLPRNKKKQLLQLLLLKIIKTILFLYTYLIVVSFPFIVFILIDNKLNLSISYLKFYSQTSGIITTSCIVIIYIILKKVFRSFFYKD